MLIPNSKRHKALFIIDVQPGFLRPWNKKIVARINALLKHVPYRLYVESVFNAERGSLWEKQQDWILPKDKNTHSDIEILEALKNFPNKIRIRKQTKSIFKGRPDLLPVLRKNKIQEIHIVGLDTNDCVLASAYEAFDLGFMTYVLEEFCGSSSSEILHQKALALLRHQCMTNNSSIEKTKNIEIF